MAGASAVAGAPVKYRRKALSRKGVGAGRSIEFPGCRPVRLRRDQIDPRNRPAGLTIHLLDSGSYDEAVVSLAFPGWTAAEIHSALNEPMMSLTTIEALRRVGLASGELGGTHPEDDPVLGAERREGRRQGRRDGRRLRVPR